MEKNGQRWQQLFENAICAFITGRAANYSQMNYTQCVDEAIFGAEYLIEELKKLEEMGEKETSSEQ